MGERNSDAKHTPTPDEMGAKCARLFFSRGYSAGGLAPMREHQLATVCSSAITLATLELSTAHSALVAKNEALVAERDDHNAAYASQMREIAALKLVNDELVAALEAFVTEEGPEQHDIATARKLLDDIKLARGES